MRAVVAAIVVAPIAVVADPVYGAAVVALAAVVAVGAAGTAIAESQTITLARFEEVLPVEKIIRSSLTISIV